MAASIKPHKMPTNSHDTKGSCPETGTGLLEMILFIPIAFTLLFLFFDCAARFYQTSAVNDLLRRTLSDAAQNRILERDISGNEVYRREKLEFFVEDLAEQLSQDLSSIVKAMPGRQTLPYAIRLDLVDSRNSSSLVPLARAELGAPFSTPKMDLSPLSRNSKPLNLQARIKGSTKGILPKNPLSKAYFQINTSWAIGLE